MTKTVEGLASIGLEQKREKLLLEIARVSQDLERVRGAVLSEVDAFARARTLSLRLAELMKERDALTGQIERVGGQPEQAQA